MAIAHWPSPIGIPNPKIASTPVPGRRLTFTTPIIASGSTKPGVTQDRPWIAGTERADDQIVRFKRVLEHHDMFALYARVLATERPIEVSPQPYF